MGYGTIIRSMVGFGFKNLGIVEPSVDIFDPKVVRSTMGAFLRLTLGIILIFKSICPNSLHTITILLC